MMLDTDTIVAIATAPGRGGIGIIRLSGSTALAISEKITSKSSLIPKKAVYTEFKTLDNTIIDSGLILYFKAPFSFTGEEVIELHGHGAPVVLDQLVKLCVHYGARLAKPGEFSLRAFLNNKIDLAQAEAIADLINSSSQTAARYAMRSLQGEFSKKINEVCNQIVYLRMYVEAAIDFPEEEVDFLNDGHVEQLLTTIICDTTRLRHNAHQGSILQEGLSIAIAGVPNVGKSTLINCLAGTEVAIVTDIAGTTRDVMREMILIDDLPIRIIDTAGLRESTNAVELEGIKRAWQEFNKADIILWIQSIDESSIQDAASAAFFQQLPDTIPIIKVINKIDIYPEFKDSERDIVYISAKKEMGIDLLKQKIKDIAGFQPEEGQFLARRRHLDALDAALNLLINGQEQLQLHRAGELLAEDLRQAHLALTVITGDFTADDLLGEIFSSFCIGK